MKQHRGFTLMELLIVISLICLILAVLLPMPQGQRMNADGTVCKGGYKFAGRDSRAVQIIDSQGHGIPCNAQ